MMRILSGTASIHSNLIGRYYRCGLFTLLSVLLSLGIAGCPQPEEDPPADTVSPIANAGKDRTIMTGQRVYLYAQKNVGDTFTYQWSQTSGPAVTFSSTTSTDTNFIAQSTGTYQIQLSVHNGDLEATDSVTITVVERTNDAVPVAKAGTDRTVPPNVTVELDGRGSIDPGGDTLTFTWRQIQGPNVELTGANTAQPTFTSPTVTDPVSLIFELYVVNSKGYDSVDTITITVDLNAKMQYNLSTKTQGSGSISPNQGTYDEGSQVEIKAAGNGGWRFDHWENDLTGTTNPATIIVNNNNFITAVFVQEGYSLTIQVEGEGSVNPSAGTYPSFTKVTLSATPANDLWKFDRWKGDLTEADNPVEITMDENKIITAVFVSSNQVSAPAFTPPSYTSFAKTLSVKLSSATSGASIYYTIDNGDPTQSDTLYTGPITLTGSSTIKARAFKDGLTPSEIVSANYQAMEVPGGIAIEAEEK
jgi:hypothetical protein